MLHDRPLELPAKAPKQPPADLAAPPAKERKARAAGEGADSAAPKPHGRPPADAPELPAKPRKKPATGAAKSPRPADVPVKSVKQPATDESPAPRTNA
jgi:hypothetical protein